MRREVHEPRERRGAARGGHEGDARDAAREDAERAFREAVTLAKGDERLHARALARLLYALASQGRAHEAGRPIAEAARDNIVERKDPIAGLLLQSSFMRLVSPQDPDLARMPAGFVEQAAAYAGDIDVARAAGQVALVCGDLGEHALAALLLEGALPVLERELGRTDAEYALMLYSFAQARGALAGRYDDVVPLLREVVAIQEAALAPGHFEKVAPLGTLGIVLGLKGEFEEGRRALEQALEISTALEGAEGPTPRLVRSALQKLEERAGKRGQAPFSRSNAQLDEKGA